MSSTIDSIKDIDLSDLDLEDVNDVIDDLFSRKTEESEPASDLGQPALETNFQDKFSRQLELNRSTKIIWKEVSQRLQQYLLSANFRIQNCEGDGNCQFRSIQNALANSGMNIKHAKLRKKIASYVRNMSADDFLILIESYRAEKHAGEFVGTWDPFQIKTKRDFIREIKKEGFNFQGDHVTLSLISRVLSIDFLIIVESDPSERQSNLRNLINILEIYGENRNNTLLILHFSGAHYQTIGYQTHTRGRSKIISSFDRRTLPDEIGALLDKNKFIQLHLDNVYDKYQKERQMLTITSLISEVSENIGKNYNSRNNQVEKKKLMKTIRIWISKKSFIHNLKMSF
jgi:hypothetical protein